MLTLAGLAAPEGALAQARLAKLEPVAQFDLDRYVGQWYELGRFPNRFQRKCLSDVVATYTRRGDGDIDVTNRCTSANGTIDAAGVARRADATGPPSVLEVRFAPAWLSFLPAVWGDYWVIDLDPEYRTVVVGTPDREYLWILSRTPQVDMPTWSRLVDAARRQGFDVTRIERTAQSEP